ncbi:MAG: GlxA family transcriptional regulator [Bacteroidota bacterium]
MDKPDKIVIVVPKGELVVSSMAGSYKLFKSAIEVTDSQVDLLIAGTKKSHSFLDGFFSVTPSIHWNNISKADLIIVPAVKEDIEGALKNNQQLMNWLVSQYKQGAHIASLCTGSFILAEAGLLKSRRCTTHWLFTDQFTKTYRDTNFSKNNIITEDERIYTSGGAYSFLNLIVYLIERFFGKEAALQIISIYQVDKNRSSQDPFVIFNTQKIHHDDDIQKVQDFIESNYERKMMNQELASIAKLGAKTLVRRFKSLTGNTPNEYLQRVRTEAAKDLLVSTQKHISEIQYRVGYSDPKTFRDIFHRYTGLTPMAYRKKYMINS